MDLAPTAELWQVAQHITMNTPRVLVVDERGKAGRQPFNSPEAPSLPKVNRAFLTSMARHKHLLGTSVCIMWPKQPLRVLGKDI